MTTLGTMLLGRFKELNLVMLLGRFKELNLVIVVASALAFALMACGGYLLFGTKSGASAHRGTNMVTVSWAVRTNTENRGDRIILSAADTVRQRFVFDAPPPEDVPLPRPRPAELIALEAPPVDLQPALGDDKREECEWDKLKMLPDFMRSCVGPPLQLTPPKR